MLEPAVNAGLGSLGIESIGASGVATPASGRSNGSGSGEPLMWQPAAASRRAETSFMPPGRAAPTGWELFLHAVTERVDRLLRDGPHRGRTGDADRRRRTRRAPAREQDVPD